MNDDIEAREKFLFTLDWLLAVNERHANAVEFGLLHVCFHDKQILGNVYGAQQAAKLLMGLAAKLRKEFRKTDLVARDGTDFWILIPYTDPSTVTEKVGQLVEIASGDGLDVVDRDMAFFNLKNLDTIKSLAADGALGFLENLRKMRHVARSWENTRAKN